ncbi:hypothetical protein EGR_00637 [Echinococcus granulosus]|uniref:Uncharacterized protein n=1 Tax=Echinococcus granulosus TaxID=6210 RepID=W6V192_ECHGR|nr:hypothetical protein EGR_00637 [Echinococcus granulosus]EUB64687.1 hypothetical protein EGR_00637 [Echinococcus granulosus]
MWHHFCHVKDLTNQQRNTRFIPSANLPQGHLPKIDKILPKQEQTTLPLIAEISKKSLFGQLNFIKYTSPIFHYRPHPVLLKTSFYITTALYFRKNILISISSWAFEEILRGLMDDCNISVWDTLPTLKAFMLVGNSAMFENRLSNLLHINLYNQREFPFRIVNFAFTNFAQGNIHKAVLLKFTDHFRFININYFTAN